MNDENKIKSLNIQFALNQIQKIWCETFGLSDLNEDFIPHLQEEVKAYVGSNIHLKIGSLLKLIQKDRLDFIDKIKPTLEEPNIVLDNNQGILFIKEFIDKNKNRYFMTVAKNYDGEWICTSHTRRELNNIKNEIKRSKIIYNKGFERSEVAGACDILESGGEVSKPSHLQIKYTTNQDFGTNPNATIPNPTLKNTESPNIQSFLGIDYTKTKTNEETECKKQKNKLKKHFKII